MKSQTFIKYTAGLGILASGLFFFQNCAPTNFQAAASDIPYKNQNCDSSIYNCTGDPNDPRPTPPPEASPTPLPPGATPTPLPPGATPTPLPPGATPTPPGGSVFPKMSLSAPVCQANTMCPVTFKLDKAYDRSLAFFWKTNDVKYQSDPARWGAPGRHYDPANGYISFAAGETTKVIHIKSLDVLQNIYIPFQWWDCRFGGSLIDCKALE